MNELVEKITKWAGEKDLLKRENAPKQMMKVMEELGETASAILKGDEEKIIDGIGDVLVTIVILSKQLGYNPSECLKIAYNEIKDRKGKTVGGTFLKN